MICGFVLGAVKYEDISTRTATLKFCSNQQKVTQITQLGYYSDLISYD